MLLRRSKDMILVGYFLSRCTVKNEKSGDLFPPKYLNTNRWNEAYLMFYEALGDGRIWPQFHHSLKNTRDSFDSHLNSGRVGWRKSYMRNGHVIREPQNLSKLEREIFEKWEKISDDSLWDVIKPFVNSGLNDISPEYIPEVIEELEIQKGFDEITSRTEGGLKVVKSRRAERSKKLRRDALKIHGHICMVCGFDFSKYYGPWGNGFAIIHHMSPLRKEGIRETDPIKDLAIVCANCHVMIHKQHGITLSLDELKLKLNPS